MASTLAVAVVPVVAVANPRTLPFTYQHEQLTAGEAEVEQFVDMTPVRARDEATGDPAWYGLTQLQTEFEQGLSDRLELGLYVSFVPSAATGFTQVPRASEGTGIKQRLRFQLAPTGAWPIDLSLYGEVAENEREIELEGKIIVQRRIGPARLIANLTAEHEMYFDGRRDRVLAPSAGLTFETSASVQPGIEWWMDAEYPEKDPPAKRPFALGPHHYVGPALLLQFGRIWWTTGLYVRASDTRHTLQPGEGFGNVWARTIVGIGL